MKGKQTEMEKSTERLKLDKSMRPVIIKTMLLGYVCITWNTHALDTSRYKWQLAGVSTFQVASLVPNQADLNFQVSWQLAILFSVFVNLRIKNNFLKKETDCYFCLLWNIHHSNDYNAQNQSFRFVFAFYVQFCFSFLNFPL